MNNHLGLSWPQTNFVVRQTSLVESKKVRVDEKLFHTMKEPSNVKRVLELMKLSGVK